MNFDIPNQVTLADLRALLQYLPQSQENQGVEQFLLQLLDKKRVILEPYTYTCPLPSIASGASTTVTMDISNDADFLVVKQTFDANIADAAQTISNTTYPLVKVLISNSGTGQQMMDQAIAVPAIFGTGFDSFDLPAPWRIEANSTITHNFTNYDAAATYEVNLHYIGYKLKKAKG